MTEPEYFPSPQEFREWLLTHHDSRTELLVGFHRVGSGRLSMTWSESVNVALCFGWIDGVRKSVDDQRYTIRFTPRKKGSNWSLINLKKMEDLRAKGLLHQKGIAIFESRDRSKEGIYSFERKQPPTLTPEQEDRFKANSSAWEFFTGQPPGYQKVAKHWVTQAKREETRTRRLEILIEDSAKGKRIDPLNRVKGSSKSK